MAVLLSLTAVPQAMAVGCMVFAQLPQLQVEHARWASCMLCTEQDLEPSTSSSKLPASYKK